MSDSGQQTTTAIRAALRRRYSPEPVPTCPYCHKAMALKYQATKTHELYGCPDDHCERDRYIGVPDVLAAVGDADALAAALAEAGRLREAFTKAREREDNLAVAVTESHDAHDRDKRALRRLRAALEYYADETHYLSRWPVKTELAEDGGQRARAALAPADGSGKEQA